MSDDTTGLAQAEREALQRLDKVDQARFDKFAEEFHAESDRAAVVLGAAKLDELLRAYPGRRVVPCVPCRSISDRSSPRSFPCS
jgi:hypothetical protein